MRGFSVRTTPLSYVTRRVMLAIPTPSHTHPTHTADCWELLEGQRRRCSLQSCSYFLLLSSKLSLRHIAQSLTFIRM